MTLGKHTNLALLLSILALSGETSAFTTSLTSRRTAVGYTAGSLSSRSSFGVNNFQLRAQRDESAVGENKLAVTPPSFLEPGGGPTVAFSADVAEDTIYQQAIKRTLLWVALAGVFGGGLWAFVDPNMGEEFFAGYLVEQSLSVDNLFVFLLLFDFFRIPLQNQDKILNWGIYGAIVMRAGMIGLGAVALENFRPILLCFAAILVYSSGKILLEGDDDEEEDMSENAIVKFSKKLFDSTDQFDGDNFFTIADGVKKATPLFLCMIAIEISDVVFAVDSVPAVFGVTENPLIVFSSNMFAIMGLRSLYTILSKAATDLKYLEPSVAVVLGFIGSKMIAEYFGYHVPTEVALLVVASFLGTGIGVSVWEKQLLEQSEQVE
eukprot:CAMPEP_0119007254 /NCGR_PEP_ID=MMETSP1176-20130426/2890_1 /TAXON_ID=265551 /ORGANISM="Synedropsis recta cf, Strain CCMP1620" /LENGTH=377 /DNA_ID=CAMNT_0006959369 /DNA_START=254 /DNA_END=1387 /DNA_ORIENTATION=-